jgi:hypothetical protein
MRHPLLYLTRKAEFAASHYYHNPDLSLEVSTWHILNVYATMEADLEVNPHAAHRKSLQE